MFMYINKFCKGLNHNIKESSGWCARLLRVGKNVNKWNLKICTESLKIEEFYFKNVCAGFEI